MVQIADRVEQKSASTGTGAVQLSTVPNARIAFNSAVTDGATVPYLIEDGNGLSWEIGRGTVTFGSPDTLSRDQVISSTASNGLITLTNNTPHTVMLVADSAYLQTLGADRVRPPYFNLPTDGATGVSASLTVETSAFAPLYSADVRNVRRLQIRQTGNAWTNLVAEKTGDKSNFTVSLSSNTDYEMRARDELVDGFVSEWSSVVSFGTSGTSVEVPSITSLSDNATAIGETPTFTSSAFNVLNGTDTHVASQWRVTRVSDSTVIHDPGDDTSNLESYTLPSGILQEGQNDYTVEVRHKGSAYAYSGWSPAITFTTDVTFFNPADASSIGAPYAGGYIAGVIDTVAGTIESQDDYQTGLRYVLVVSPKDYEGGSGSSPASGLTTGSLKWDAYNNPPQSGTITRWNGLESTNSVITQSSTEFQAFNFINEVRSQYPAPTISGGSEWYLPAMDELELIYRNLKAQAINNDTGNLSYTFPNTSDFGFNPSSDPTSSAYSTSDPSQTSVTVFQTGNVQALDLGRYWASTDANESYNGNGRAWQQKMFDSSGSAAGSRSAYDKDYSDAAVRPVRRIVL